MTTEEELAFLKVHVEELYPAFLRQVEMGIIAEKKREAEARVSSINPALPRGGGGTTFSQKAPKPKRVRAKPMNWAYIILAIH
jgi:hypothetical protein